MPESEPSAPLPEPTITRAEAMRQLSGESHDALAAATRRAERAERERDDFKGLAATAADWLQSTRRDLDQARAQLAKVRMMAEALEGLAAIPTFRGRGVVAGFARDLRAALDPVGATEDEARP